MRVYALTTRTCQACDILGRIRLRASAYENHKNRKHCFNEQSGSEGFSVRLGILSLGLRGPRLRAQGSKVEGLALGRSTIRGQCWELMTVSLLSLQLQLRILDDCSILYGLIYIGFRVKLRALHTHDRTKPGKV